MNQQRHHSDQFILAQHSATLEHNGRIVNRRILNCCEVWKAELSITAGILFHESTAPRRPVEHRAHIGQSAGCGTVCGRLALHRSFRLITFNGLREVGHAQLGKRLVQQGAKTFSIAARASGFFRPNRLLLRHMALVGAKTSSASLSNALRVKLWASA